MIYARLAVEVDEDEHLDVDAAFDLTEEQFQLESDNNFEYYVAYISSLLPVGKSVDGSVYRGFGCYPYCLHGSINEIIINTITFLITR